MNNRCRKRFAAWLKGCVFSICLSGGVVTAQTDAPTAITEEAVQLSNLQEMLRANQGLQEQLHAIELTLDQSLTNSQDLFRINLELQERLQATRIALDQNQKEAEAAAARSAEMARNAEGLAARLDLLEQDLADQRVRELEVVHRSNRFMLIVAAAFAGVGLLAVLLTAYLHWRAPNLLSALPVAYARGQGHAVASVGPVGNSLVPVGQTEQSTARLLGAVGRLEKRVLELEQPPQVGKTMAAPAANAHFETTEQPGPADSESCIASLLGKGQSLLNLDQQENAIGCFDKILQLDPNHAEALVKKGAALEQLDRLEEAIACYDRAVAANPLLTIAYLRKGGLCNRLARSSEALVCYEQALRTQEKQVPLP